METRSRRKAAQNKPPETTTATTRKRKRNESASNNNTNINITDNNAQSTDEASAIRPKKKAKASSPNPILDPALAKDEYEEPKELSVDFPLDPVKTKSLLESLVAKRNCLLKELIKENNWRGLMPLHLGSPYDQYLPGELKSKFGFTDAARHFIYWNIHPHTIQLEDFINRHLSTEAIQFLDSLQQFADRYNDDEAFNSLMKHVIKNIGVSDNLPASFDRFIFSAWSRIETYQQANKEKWTEVDWCKNIYSIIDQLMLREFNAHSAFQSEQDNDVKSKHVADFEVSKVINGNKMVFLVGKDDPLKNRRKRQTIELFELMHGICQDAGFDGDKVAKYGVLNRGNGSIIFRAEEEKSEIQIENKTVLIPKLNISWILGNEEDYTTFTYSPKDFSTLLKSLAALFLGMKESYDLEAKKPPKKKAKPGEEKKEQYNDDITSKEFGHLFPNKTSLLNYAIIEQKENIWYLESFKNNRNEEFVAKWCYSEGRDLPYEWVVISMLPLKTVLQPIEWASVDNNRYHVMIFDRLYHSKVGALQNFVSSVRGIVATLDHMHKKELIHGDFKFHNTMYSLERGPFIIDFDCTHLLVDADENWYASGTVGHRSPEQILRKKCTDKSEMYSFGIWLIEWFFQQSLHRILATYRPDFNDDENEIETGKVLSEIFEEYVDSKSYNELWTTHPIVVAEKTKLSEPCLTMKQFKTFRAMVRELLDEDLEKRPSCNELMTDPKYKPFFGDKSWEPVLIKKELRKLPKSHAIESYLARIQKKK